MPFVLPLWWMIKNHCAEIIQLICEHQWHFDCLKEQLARNNPYRGRAAGNPGNFKLLTTQTF
jgi:hypothetical protein